jgi:hypothetical protein
MKVRMTMQMSGSRFDGQPWPPVGGVLEVSDAEGAELCHLGDSSNVPIAVPVVEMRKAETTDSPKDVRAEVRGSTTTTSASSNLPPRPASAAADTPDDEPKARPKTGSK